MQEVTAAVVYLDNAATTFPKPESVIRAVSLFMRTQAANPGRSGHRLSMKAAKEVYACREVAAEFFGAPGPECIAFTLNATQAINMALKGAVKKGRVITSDLEHNAVMRPLEAMARAHIITYDEARVDFGDDDATVNSFAERITPDTVMIACTHASNVCGRVLPIERIGRLCRERGLLFLVDASQTAGLLPVDITKMNIDFLCMPGHKSLMGPMGTGMLITARGEKLATIIEGGTGSVSSSLGQPDFMPDRLESGTINAPGIAGLRAGIKYIALHGRDKILAREAGLAAGLFEGLREIKGVRLYMPFMPQSCVPVVSFNIGAMSSVKAASLLDEAGFAVRGGLHCAPEAHRRFGTLSQGMVRASIGAFNSAGDTDGFIRAVRKIQKDCETT
jgi:cysteine desulfurase/selenocysteine lyase